MIGKMPTVLNIAIHTNQIKCLFLADFQRAISFQIASQTANYDYGYKNRGLVKNSKFSISMI